MGSIDAPAAPPRELCACWTWNHCGCSEAEKHRPFHVRRTRPAAHLPRFMRPLCRGDRQLPFNRCCAPYAKRVSRRLARDCNGNCPLSAAQSLCVGGQTRGLPRRSLRKAAHPTDTDAGRCALPRFSGCRCPRRVACWLRRGMRPGTAPWLLWLDEQDRPASPGSAGRSSGIGKENQMTATATIESATLHLLPPLPYAEDALGPPPSPPIRLGTTMASTIRGTSTT